VGLGLGSCGVLGGVARWGGQGGRGVLFEAWGGVSKKKKKKPKKNQNWGVGVFW